MADWKDTSHSAQRVGSVPRAGGQVSYDDGLRKYMLGIYNYMASAVLLTGIVAMLVSQTGLVYTMFNPETGAPTLLYWGMVAAPFILAMWLQVRIFHMSVRSAQTAYWTYAVLIGASIASIFIVYTPISIAQTFFATAAAFAGLSLFGYTTKRDLSGFGTFLVMGIWGLFAAMLLNVLVFKSPLADLVMSGVGILLFAGFTAYRTQELKEMYGQVRGDSGMMARVTIIGALHLYMSFVNLFLFLLRFMGNRE